MEKLVTSLDDVGFYYLVLALATVPIIPEVRTVGE